MKQVTRPPALRTLALASLALATVVTGCGPTRAPTKVLRQPNLLLPSKAYTLETKLDCFEEVVGPDRVRVTQAQSQDTTKLGGITVTTRSSQSTLELERRRLRCPRPDVAQAVVSLIEQGVRRQLRGGGYHEAQGGAPVQIQVQLRHERYLERLREHTDRKKDKTCQKACGKKTCTQFAWKGSARIEVQVSGPPFEKHHQEHKLYFSPTTLRGVSNGFVHACSAQSLLPAFNDPKRYDWDRVRRYVADGVRDLDRWRGMARPYTERYDLTLMDSGVDHPAFSQGLDQAKRAAARASRAKPKHWEPAALAFAEALAGSTEAEAKGRAGHNLAAVQMVRGDLAKARDSAQAAMTLAQQASDEDTAKALRHLLREIQRRQIDERKRIALERAPLAGR